VHVAHETHAANRVRLLAEREALPADVLIRASDGARDLVERHAVFAEAKRIDIHVVLARLAAERHDIGDARDLRELSPHHPLLRGLELAEALRMRGRRELVAKDFADRVPRTEPRVHAVGERPSR